MKMKNIVAFNENGNLKSNVRAQLYAFVAAHKDAILIKAEKVEGKNIYYLPIEDANGNIVYINFDVSVSSTHPANRRAKRRVSRDEMQMEGFED